MLELWERLPHGAQACITIALLLLTGCLLLQCVGGAIAERVQSEGLQAVLVLVVAAEIAAVAND